MFYGATSGSQLPQNFDRAAANGAHRAQSSSLHGVLLDLFVAAILHAIGRGVPLEAQELGQGIGDLEERTASMVLMGKKVRAI